MELAHYGSPASTLPARARSGSVRRRSLQQVVLTVVSIGVAVIIGLSILKMRHPEVYYNITLSMDVFGITPDAEAEKDRIESIALLPISDEKKDFLINHTIFMGATSNMVKLALGKPRVDQQAMSQTGEPVKVLIYHFPQDSRPTMFMFEKEKLVSAQKISESDVLAYQQ